MKNTIEGFQEAEGTMRQPERHVGYPKSAWDRSAFASDLNTLNNTCNKDFLPYVQPTTDGGRSTSREEENNGTASLPQAWLPNGGSDRICEKEVPTVG
jgi:hypothetical protein